MQPCIRTGNASVLAIARFCTWLYGARRKREGAAKRRIRAAAWLDGAVAHAVSEKEPPSGGFELSMAGRGRGAIRIGEGVYKVEHRIKMIGLDLDGTLLNEKKEITPYSRNVIKKALDAGIIVLVATGRPWMGIPEELREFPGMRYALTSNGARIIDREKGTVMKEQLLSVELAKKALEICGKYDTLQEVYLDGQGYAPNDKRDKVERYHHNPNMWEYIRTTRIWVDDICEFTEKGNKGLDKIQALFADMAERTKAWEELSGVRGLALVGSLGYNIEINAAGVNKGAGLVELGKLLGIKREEIMACGDGDNDTEMLREVGVGVAMANGEEQVKKAADYITESNEADGAAKAIEKIALGGGERIC